MDVIKISPRGYCYGVVDAMLLAQRVARDPDVPRPVYILGMIVHNQHVVNSLARQGVITLDGADRLSLLEGIDRGTVIFTAHGVSPQVIEVARRKGLNCLDATCPDVTRTHDIIRQKAAAGFDIIYIGKKGHPEPEGAVGEAPGRVHLIEDEADLARLDLRSDRVAVVTQTTLSRWDTEALIELVKERFAGAEVHNEICHATQSRQEAAVEQSKDADVVIVVGDRRSNNSNRLVQVVQEIAGKPAYLVDDVHALDLRWLEGRRRVAVTAGASTPSQITREVIRFLELYDPDEPERIEAALRHRQALADRARLGTPIPVAQPREE